MPKPRKITINETQNPTGLSMDQRQLALNVLASLEASVATERKRVMKSHRFQWNPWGAEDEQELRRRVYRSAYNQLTGRQKSENGPFTLSEVAVPTGDMDYVLKSLGVVINK